MADPEIVQGPLPLEETWKIIHVRVWATRRRISNIHKAGTQSACASRMKLKATLSLPTGPQGHQSGRGTDFLPLVASETFMLANYKVVTLYTKSHVKIIKNASHVPGGKRRIREGQRYSVHLRSW